MISPLAVMPDETIWMISRPPLESVAALALPPDSTMSSPPYWTTVPLARPPLEMTSRPPLETVVPSALPEA